METRIPVENTCNHLNATELVAAAVAKAAAV